MCYRKWLLVSVAALGLQTAGFAQQKFNYEISGKIPGAEKIFLTSDIYGARVLDSSKRQDGSFVFRGTAQNITLGSIVVESKKRIFSQNYSVFIEPGKITVKPYPKMQLLEIRGSRNNDIMTTVESRNAEFWTKIPGIYDSLNYASMKAQDLRKEEVVNNDSVAYFQDLHERMANAATPYIVARNKQLKAAYAKYPTSYFTAYNALYSGSSTEEELKKIYAGFDDKMKESAIGKEWYERLFKVRRLEAGSVAPEFAIADMNGKQVKLSDMKGKYLLLDFWATWCGPCRAGNPHLVSLYNKYKSSGLEIIGIADDDKNIAGWKKAVKDDGIGIWPQVLRNRGAQTPEGEEADLAKLYMVSSYPTKILIDKTGKIVHQFSDDAELDSMLSTIFENK